MKLLGDVRSVERAFGNGGNGQADKPEKRNFKIQVRPASKPDSYYGYGHMQFILHGRELEDCGLDLGTKVSLYLVPEGEEVPDVAQIDDVRRKLYEAENQLNAAQEALRQATERANRVERDRLAAGQERQALQAENVRLTVELITLKGAAGFAPAPQMIDANPRSASGLAA